MERIILEDAHGCARASRRECALHHRLAAREKTRARCRGPCSASSQACRDRLLAEDRPTASAGGPQQASNDSRLDRSNRLRRPRANAHCPAGGWTLALRRRMVRLRSPGGRGQPLLPYGDTSPLRCNLARSRRQSWPSHEWMRWQPLGLELASDAAEATSHFGPRSQRAAGRGVPREVLRCSIFRRSCAGCTGSRSSPAKARSGDGAAARSARTSSSPTLYVKE
jgi:hypothetical protein